ncbi:major facilitator superfamily domain-containing protein [Syncephalastrum racemosum]|uniref:Major facilitator superfamily domain-containing protein n=1 Tax=Syncephalastrum racemosum TaxID=13706 RepID=A0A1X2HWG9_SYNRA|nr:major facilitator superfamily domain-containing protein [Syncephalastrum racemosum]
MTNNPPRPLISKKSSGLLETAPLLTQTQSPWRRWCVLLGFSLFSFSSALMWVAFAPCLYIFSHYYFGPDTTTTRTNAINCLSNIYMLLYPILVQSTFPFFEDKGRAPGTGLKQGVLIGAVLNVVGAAIRWQGAFPSITGFAVLFLGQIMAAIAQVFMLAVPPRLAGAWFPANEINLATSIAVSANNLGIAAGCVWTPLVVHTETMATDIPKLLFQQFLLAVAALVLLVLSLQRPAPNPTWSEEDIGNSREQSKQLWKEFSFLYMLVAYGILYGGQCAVVTLLAQILLPPFQGQITENYIGWLGFFTLFVGFPSSVAVGSYLDRAPRYRTMCIVLFVITASSLIGLYLATEFRSLTAVTVSCLTFGLSSSAIGPALFQYASELYYPISELIPTGYLFTVGNIGGALLVAIMGWTENMETDFSMRIPVLCMALINCACIYTIVKVDGPLKRSVALDSATS